jgi:Flp pilus assembly protein TadB
MIYVLLGIFAVAVAILVYVSIQSLPGVFHNRVRQLRERLKPRVKVEARVREKLHVRESYHDKVRWKLGEVRWPIGLGGFYLSSIFCALMAIFLMVSVGDNWWAGVILSPIGFLTPTFLLERVYQKKQAKQDEALEGIIDQISNLYRVHGSFYRALFEATQKMEGALQDHFQKALADYNAGQSMADVLEELAFRLRNPDLHLLTLTVGLHEKYGGPTDQIVAQISETIRERRTLRAERKAETAGQNVMLTLLLVTPPFLYLLILLWLPEFRSVLENTLWGQVGVAFMTFNEVVVILLLRWLTTNQDI